MKLLDQTITKWKDLCVESNHTEYICMKDKIFYINRNSMEWSDARIQCLQKFGGSQKLVHLAEMNNQTVAEISPFMETLLKSLNQTSLSMSALDIFRCSNSG